MASEFHGRMMNIQVDQYTLSRESASYKLCYKTGHRDARHAAAEIALEADAEIERLTARLASAEAEIERLRAHVAKVVEEFDDEHARLASAEAALARAREEALEEAAKEVDLDAQDCEADADHAIAEGRTGTQERALAKAEALRDTAARIRALRNGETGGGER